MQTANNLPRRVYRLIAWLWLAFWLIKIGNVIQMNRLNHEESLWQPLLAEGTSFFVTTIFGALQLRFLPLGMKTDAQPWRWLGIALIPLPLWCLLFPISIYGLRQVISSALGQPFWHPDWIDIYLYESLQICLYFLLWTGVIYGISAREYLVQERQSKQEVSIALRDARLSLLRQQLQPHFLFNALNLVSATMYENVPKADELLRKLASLQRKAAEQTEQPTHALRDEISLLRDYADIMAARFENRVNVRWQIAPDLPDCQVPSMISQALLENAFKHGVEPYSGKTELLVQIDRDTSRSIFLSIMQSRGHYEAQSNAGLGLENVRHRLAAHYGENAKLEILNLQPEGVCAKLTLPCES